MKAVESPPTGVKVALSTTEYGSQRDHSMPVLRPELRSGRGYKQPDPAVYHRLRGLLSPLRSNCRMRAGRGPEPGGSRSVTRQERRTSEEAESLTTDWP